MLAQQTWLELETQQEAVKHHLHTTGSITPMEALSQYGCFRLGSIIHRLRRRGWKIETHREGAQGYARYCLLSSPEKPVEI